MLWMSCEAFSRHVHECCMSSTSVAVSCWHLLLHCPAVSGQTGNTRNERSCTNFHDRFSVLRTSPWLQKTQKCRALTLISRDVSISACRAPRAIKCCCRIDLSSLCNRNVVVVRALCLICWHWTQYSRTVRTPDSWATMNRCRHSFTG
jgi:hypothetical protein